MSLQPVWECLRTRTNRFLDVGKTAWCELRDVFDTTPLERLPDAAALEDRVLFNSAPVDAGAVLTVQTHTGEYADLAGAGQAAAAVYMPQGTLGEESPAMPQGNSASADWLLADDRYISVNPEDRIIAAYDLGGYHNPDARNIAMGIENTGWDGFIDAHIEPLIDKGVMRFELHTPFGQRSLIVDPETGAVTRPPGQWGFQFDAYLDALVELPEVTDDFVSAWQDFFARHEGDGQVQDVIPYIGSPRLDADQIALTGDPDAWWDRAYDVITPMLEAGFRSIGFDASGTATQDTLDYDLHNVLRYPELRDPVRDARLIEIVGDERVEVYLEAMPLRSTERTDFPVLVLDYDYTRQDPERPGAHFEFRQENFFEHDRLTGEVIRIVRHEQWRADGFEPVEDVLLDGDIAAVTPLYFLRPSNGGAETLDEYIAKMDLPSLPTDVDLDPDDLNPDSAQYVITVDPEHGTLTSNRFHDDVFTYKPDPYFTGVDSFEYTVYDGTGGAATAVVTFFVNTPVDESHAPADAADPPVLPPAANPGGSPSGPVDPPNQSGSPSGPAVVETPTPPAEKGSAEPDLHDPPADDASGGQTSGGAGGASNPPSPPVQPPPADPPASSPNSPDASGGQTGQIDSPPANSDPPTDEQSSSQDDPVQQPSPAPGSTIDTITDLAEQNGQSITERISAILPPDSDHIISALDEAEDYGLFAGALSIELLNRPMGPTLRVNYGFGVLQFLVSSIHDWLPRP